MERLERTQHQGRSDDEFSLVARAQQGDAEAFARLVQASDTKMRGLAYRLVGDQATMDDVLQDAYLKAYRSLHQFELVADGARFSTWLYRIVHTTCLDHFRRVKRRPQSQMRLVDTMPDSGEDPGLTVARRAEIRSALASLPPDQAAVVALVDGDGYSYEDVAETLGIAPGTVGSRLSRGRAAMRDQLEPTRKAQR